MSCKNICLDKELLKKFYKKTEIMLKNLAGNLDLEKYFNLTDYQSGSVILRFEGLSQVFAQLALHAQNGSHISGIVKFNKNIDFLCEKLFNFDPVMFNAYVTDEIKKGNEPDKLIVERLRYNSLTNRGIYWDDTKSKPKNKDKLMIRYANTLIDCAKWLVKFNSRDEFLTDLKSHYVGEKYIDKVENIVKYFKNNIKTGFGKALTCDFLKEFDSYFDIVKPDIHIKDTLSVLLGCNNEELKDEFVIKIMKQITDILNEELSKPITMYKLDKMLWLICSQNFYLDNISGYKNIYLSGISELNSEN